MSPTKAPNPSKAKSPARTPSKRRKPVGNHDNPFQAGRRKNAWLLAGLLIIVMAGWYSYEQIIARPAMVFAGVPTHQDWQTQLTKRIIRNDAFMVGYSDWLGNPLWVTYQVSPRPDNAAHLPRPRRFDSDWRSLRCLTFVACVTHRDYTGSGYNRGHLAPNHIIATRYGAKAQQQTFLMTNISPQRPHLNQRTWQRIEALAANQFSQTHAPFWVITGPIFNDKPSFLSSSAKRIAIPDSFYKIFIKPSETADQLPKVLAFIVPQTVRGNEDLRQFLVTVNEIETQTGLNFFHQLGDEVEHSIESRIDKDSWGLTQRLANQRARY